MAALLNSLSFTSFAAFALSVVTAVLLLSSAALVIGMMLHRRPASRHCVLLAGLITALLAPAVVSLFQATGTAIASIELPHPDATAPGLSGREPVAPGGVPSHRTVATSREPVFTGNVTHRLDGQPMQAAASLEDRGPVELEDGHPAQSRLATTPVQQWNPLHTAVIGLSLIWIAGTSYCLLRLIRGFRSLNRIGLASHPHDDSRLEGILKEAKQILHMQRLPAVQTSDTATVPFAAGLRSPVIIVPPAVLEQATRAQLLDIVLHELAHILRRDHLVILLQHLAAALYWPIVPLHLLNLHLAKVREELCDNHVLTIRDPAAYAETLLWIAQSTRTSRLPIAAMGILHWRGKLEQRIADLIDGRRSRATGIAKRSAVFIATVFALSSLALCGIRLLAVQDETATEQFASAPAAESEDAEMISITGNVVDEAGRPIAEAFIWLSVEEKWESTPDGAPVITQATTAEDGGFTLKVASSVLDQFVKSQSTKYQFWTQQTEYALTRVEFPGGLPGEPIKIIMQPAPVVTMLIRNPDGSPCADADIAPSAIRMESDSYVVIPSVVRRRMAAPTNSNGQVDLVGLEHRQLRSLHIEKADLGLQSCHFNSRTESMPTEITLGRVGSLEGHLLPTDGAEVDLTEVKLRIVTMSTTGPDQREYRVGEVYLSPDEAGRFAIPKIREGTVRVWVHEPAGFGYRSNPPGEELTVKPGQTSTLTIPLRPAVQVARQIRDAETKEPIPGVRVNMQRGVQHIHARTDADGWFRAWILPGERYHTVYDLPSNYMSQNVSIWHETTADHNRPSELPPIDLMHSRTVEGVVVDPEGSPMQDVRVGVDWNDSNEDFGFTTEGAALDARAWGRTDEQGRFVVEGVHPKVSLTVTPVRAGILLGPSVSVEPDDQGAIRLETNGFHFLALSGRILDQDEAPIASARVVVEYLLQSRAVRAHTMHTDNDGRFTTPPHLPRNRTYRLAIKAPRGGETVLTTTWQTFDESNQSFNDIAVDRESIIE